MRSVYFILFFYSTIVTAIDVEWIVLDFPPYYIISDQSTGLGRDESLIELISNSDPSIKSSFLRVPVSRALYQLKDTEKLRCIVSLYKTEDRSLYVSFSANYSTIGLPITMSLTKKTAARLGLVGAKSASLAQLLVKDKSLIIGFTENRAFGHSIDQILANVDDNQKESRPGLDALQSLTTMLIKGRVSIVLGYASEHFYAQQRLDKDNVLTQIEIQETPDFIHGYVGCSKHPDAPHFLAELDQHLETLHSTTSYREIMLRWLPDYLKPQLIKFVPESVDNHIE